MTDGRRYDRIATVRMETEQYAALERLVSRGQYESPAHAIRRAVVMLLSLHGETVEEREAA